MKGGRSGADVVVVGRTSGNMGLITITEMKGHQEKWV